jgi:hypothetical protein
MNFEKNLYSFQDRFSCVFEIMLLKKMWDYNIYFFSFML